MSRFSETIDSIKLARRLGVAREQLDRCLQEMAGNGPPFEIRMHTRRNGHGGYGKEKLLFNLACRSLPRRDAIEGFAKVASTDKEGQNYIELSRLGGPVPKYFGILKCRSGDRVLFLEAVKTVGEQIPFRRFFSDPKRLRSALAALAHLNAVQPGAAWRKRYSRRDCQVFMRGAPAVLEEIQSRAAQGELGQRIRRLCQRNQEAIQQLKARPAKVAALVAKMKP